MELWLVVEGTSGVQREVAVDARGSHAVAELLAALGLPAGQLLALRRTGRVLDPSAPLSDSGLRTGDVLVVGPLRHGQEPRAAADLRLVVATGPASGLVAPLPPGSFVVGRSLQADITVPDPALSRAHLRLEVRGQDVVAQDEGSTNGTYVYGRRLTAPRPLEPGTLVEAGDSVLRVEVARDDTARAPLRDGRLQFSRSPRVRPPDIGTAYRLDAPPDVLPKRRIPLATSLLPLAAVPVMAATGVSAESYLLMAALSPAMAVTSFLEDRRSGRKDRDEKLRAFYASVESASQRMELGLESEVLQRWTRHPDPAEITRRAAGPSSTLWERRPTDPDFLQLRVGHADQPSKSSWSVADGGDPVARERAADVLDRYALAPTVPLVADLTASPVVGLAGSRDQTDATARWLVAQASVLHSPRDLVVAVAVTAERAARWEWAAWLPHARADAVPLAAHPIAIGHEAAGALITGLRTLVNARTDAAQRRLDTGPTGVTRPAVLLVLDGELKVPSTAVAALLEQAPAVGVRIVWLGSDRVASLPGETQVILDHQVDGLVLTDVTSGSSTGPARTEGLSVDQAQTLSRALAGVRDATAGEHGRAELPASVPLHEVLGGDPTPELVLQTWDRHRGGLGAPIGVAADGPYDLDLRRDGPHALLGGTTGAGKSELLQTFVASLAATVPPTRLTFFLVDYKGGAAFKDCIPLPHVVGLVTDLDGHLVERALVSLNAELHRREQLFKAVGANGLIEMELKAPDKAPPALFLVVDEFATLAKELPSFVDGVVNVAQRGRSLGIHMLLATQRPAGAINDNIRANTNLRMALRMNDAADSQDVLNSDLAAALPRAQLGRAYIRSGDAELVEVQVAYAGGRSVAGGREQALLVHPLSRGRVQRAVQERAVVDHRLPTDIQLLVGSVRAAAERLALPEQPPPWLPALPELLLLERVAAPTRRAAVAEIGMLDLPTRQAQEPAVVDLEVEGSVLVFGTSGSGKTTLLRTIAVSLARNSSPEELHVYGLDFATRGLSALESLPHVGAVIGGDDVERVQRLFGMLERAVAQRKDRFAAAGATSLGDFTRLTGSTTAIPRIVVLLDSYSGFTSVFDAVDYGRVDSLPQLISEGRPLGIHFVVTADRRQAVPLALTSTVPFKIVLKLADPDDYALLGLDGRVARATVLPAGRGFMGSTVEVQCAVVGDDPAGDAQLNAVKAVGQELQSRLGAGSASTIGTLPSEVTLASVLDAGGPLRPALGIGERDLTPVTVDLDDGHFLVTGPNRSGKSTALSALAQTLRSADLSLEMHLLSPRRSPLRGLDVFSSVALGVDEIERLCTVLRERLPDRAPDGAPMVLIVDDGHELADTDADSILAAIARRGRDADVRLVAAAEITAAHRAYGGWLQEVRKDRQGLLLQPDADVDGDLLGVRLPRTRTLTLSPGRGALVTRAGIEVVQVAAT